MPWPSQTLSVMRSMAKLLSRSASMTVSTRGSHSCLCRRSGRSVARSGKSKHRVLIKPNVSETCPPRSGGAWCGVFCKAILPTKARHIDRDERRLRPHHILRTAAFPALLTLPLAARRDAHRISSGWPDANSLDGYRFSASLRLFMQCGCFRDKFISLDFCFNPYVFSLLQIRDFAKSQRSQAAILCKHNFRGCPC